jgi:pectate lyase
LIYGGNSDMANPAVMQDGQVDISRASDWITVSWNYLHDHWKSSLVGNSDALRDVDFGKLHITYHHNYWKNSGTRGPAGRFGHQHIYNNVYENFLYQALHSRSDNQMLVEGNVFRGNTREALSTYGLVIPEDSPNTCTCGDEELDGFANLGASKSYLEVPKRQCIKSLLTHLAQRTILAEPVSTSHRRVTSTRLSISSS